MAASPNKLEFLNLEYWVLNASGQSGNQNVKIIKLLNKKLPGKKSICDWQLLSSADVVKLGGFCYFKLDNIAGVKCWM